MWTRTHLNHTARRWRAKARSAACVHAVALAILFLVPVELSRAAHALTVDSHWIVFPPLTEVVLDQGRSETHQARGVYAIRVDVNPQGDGGGWALYVRAGSPMFSPPGEGKRSTDMSWKLDHEDASAYRPLENYDALVLERPSGGREAVTVDLSVELDWCTSPERYVLDLVFTVVCE